jgi:putative phosphoribosyl transferase
MPFSTRFPDRAAAGKALATRLLDETTPPTVVLGVPNGGICVAAPIAKALAAPLCAVWLRKLCSPREPDVVLGVVDVDGDVTLAPEIALAEGIDDEAITELAYHAHQALLEEWERMPGLDASSMLLGATAIVVDDCMNTGLTLRAAIRWARRQAARRVVAAVPVVDARIWPHIEASADRAICLDMRDEPIARSDVYDSFRRATDDEIALLLSDTISADRSTSPHAR